MINSFYFKVYCFLFLIICNTSLIAQHTQKTDLQTRQKVFQNIVLLKNNQNSIPIEHLESAKIALISNLVSKNYLQETLEKYAKISRFNFNTIIDSSSEKRTLNTQTIAIIALYTINDIQRLKQINFSQKKIILVFSNAVLTAFLATKIKHNVLIFIPDSKQVSQELVAQLIFGGIAAKGKLQNTFSSFYKKGFGLTTKKTRLSYSIPEEVGMDSKFIDIKIDSIMAFAIKNLAFPGAQLLVAKNNTVIYHKTFGYHTYDSIQKVQSDDIYDLASITKIIGPLPALMKLYDEKRIKLDAPFSNYLSSWKSKKDKKKLTLREILTHQAGLSPYIVFLSKVLEKGVLKRRYIRKVSSKQFSLKAYENLFVNTRFESKMLRIIRRSEVSDSKKYKYSGLSFLVFPSFISNFTGITYEEYLQKEFYKPLGAYTLGFTPIKKSFLNHIVPTEVDTFFRKTLTKGWVHDENAALLGGISGNAGLFATATDLAKIMQLYVQKGNYGGRRYFSTATVNEFIKVQYPKNKNRRGLGFDKPLLNNSQLDITSAYPAPEVSSGSFGHAGFTGTFVWADPENQLVFIFLSNRVYPTRKNRNLYTLNIRPALQQVFYQALLKRKKAP